MAPFLVRFALAVLIAASGFAATTSVTTTADSGTGSLRQALLDAASGVCAAPCTIELALPEGEPIRFHRIVPQSPLPNLTAPGTVVDGTTQTAIADTNPMGPEVALDGLALSELSGLRVIGCDGCAVRGLAIYGFPGHGVLVQDSREVLLEDVWLGFLPGWEGRGNRMDAVAIVRSNGTVVRESVLSANGSNGAYITGSSGTVVRDSRIGSTFGFESDIPNAANGVHLHESSDTLIEDNVIAFNRHHGINVTGDAHGNRFIRNRIHSNGLLGIDLGGDGRDPIDAVDLDDGPNGRTNAPVVESTEGTCSEATVRGHIDALPSTTYRIEVFSIAEPDVWGTGEGRRYVGATEVSTDGSGTAEWSVLTTDDLDQWIAATATNENGSTSEFSAPIALVDPTCADLLVELQGPFRPVPAGEMTGFTSFIYNLGPHPSAARELTFRIDAGTIVEVSPACTIDDARQARCTIPSLPFKEAGSRFDLGFHVRAPEETTDVTATATLAESAASPDPVRSNDAASMTIAVSALPNLKHYIEIPFGENDPGSRIEFPVHIWNEGSGDAGGVVLTIETTPAVPVEEVSAVGWDCSPIAAGIRCTHPAVTGGARGTIHFAVLVPESGRVRGPIRIQTSLTSISGDSEPGDIQELAFIHVFRARFVTNLEDSGFGSLRQAMIEVQEPDCDHGVPCKVMFRIPPELATEGVFTIRPLSPLPPIRQQYVVIDGLTQALFAGDTNPAGPEIEIDGSLSSPGSGFVIELGRIGGVELRVLTINGWDGHGVEIAAGEILSYQNNALSGLFIGTDPTGSRVVPNRGHGVFIRAPGDYSTIQASFRCPGEWRPDCQPALIGGNEGDGIRSGGAGLSVRGVRIGTAVSGAPLPNRGNGATFTAGSRGSFDSSWIQQNEGDGIRLLDPTAAAHLWQTSIRSNGELGIDVGEDGVSAADIPDEDGVLNAPEIVSTSHDEVTGRSTIVLTVPGLEPPKEHHYRAVALFASREPDPSGHGEGARPLDVTFRTTRIDDRTVQVELYGDPRGEWLTAVIFEYFQPYLEAPRTWVRMSEFGKAHFMEP